MKRGYIKLWRKFMSHPLWQEKRKFSRAEAWVDMILQANGIDKEVIFDGRIIMVKRGKLLTSERKLAQRWDWSKTKTRLFLKQLQNSDHSIELKSDRKKTVITIINYHRYNPQSEKEKTTDLENRKTTERPLENHRLAPTKDREMNYKLFSSLREEEMNNVNQEQRLIDRLREIEIERVSVETAFNVEGDKWSLLKKQFLTNRLNDLRREEAMIKGMTYKKETIPKE